MATDAQAAAHRVVLTVEGMSCASCVGRITAALENEK
eukprot:SAG31_NODE_42098_length_273_cov_0.591954_1_plen_36_part_01